MLLDDCGHQSFQQIVTVKEAINHSKGKSIILVEDTVTSFLKDFIAHGDFSFLEFAKDASDLFTGMFCDIYLERFSSNVCRVNVDEFRKVSSIQFFYGMVAFYIDSTMTSQPFLIRNQIPNGASDYRYEGVNSANLSWPSLFLRRSVEVKGGITRANRNYRAAFKKLIPSNIRTLIRNILRINK